MRLKACLFVVLAVACGTVQGAETAEAVRNYGVTNVEATVPATSAPAPQFVAFGYRRVGCCGGNFGAAFAAYSTYQPGYYSSFYGHGAMPGYVYGNGAPWVYNTPNPYGYYPNGMIWGSSRPTYAGPFPVWNSPSGYYGYRYNGWGSYGWGGWGGTGPAGWGYQGGFYW